MHKNIKILVAYHNPAPLLNDKSVFLPIHGGREIFLNSDNVDPSVKKWMLENTIGDNTGDNISEKNWRYNEMSVIYWAFKNYEDIGNPDYIGFMHYRRHFIFDSWAMPSDKSWTFNVDYQDSTYNEIIKYSETTIQNYIKKYELIHTYAQTDNSVYEQYKKGPMHRISDLDMCISIAKEMYPDYLDSIDSYINGKKNYFCNMFIMTKKLFFEYCNWLFPILERFDECRDYSNMTYEEARFFVSERLTGIFIHHHILKGTTHCPLSITMIKNPDIFVAPYPAFKNNNVPVVFSADDNYAPMLGVTLTSLVKNSSSNNNYDIFILYEKISHNNMIKLQEIFHGKSNFSLRFINICNFITDDLRKKMYIEIHVSLATYYRFFIGRIFNNYKKVIYLDSDIVINRDIANLYSEELGDYWLGAVIDIRESIPVTLEMEVSNRNWKDYVVNTLGLENPYCYFQAGVLLFNVQAFIHNNIEDKLIEALLRIKNPILSDQDVLNSVCYDHVKFIPTRWNIEWQIPFEFSSYKKVMPIANYENYIDALKHPYIVHYASSLKPWKDPNLPLASLWWLYARESVYYEYFIKLKDSFTNDFAKWLLMAYRMKKSLYKFMSLVCFSKKNRKKYREKYKIAKHKIKLLNKNIDGGNM